MPATTLPTAAPDPAAVVELAVDVRDGAFAALEQPGLNRVLGAPRYAFRPLAAAAVAGQPDSQRQGSRRSGNSSAR